MGHHVGENHVDRKHEADRQNYGKYCDAEFFCFDPEHLEQAVAYGHSDNRKKIDVAGNMKVPVGQHCLDDGRAGEPEEDVPRYLETLYVKHKHPRHQAHHHHHHRELSGRHPDDCCLGEFDGHHEDYDRNQRREQHQPAHPLTVKDKEQSQIRQRRASLLLSKNQQNRHEDNRQRFQIVRSLGVEVEIIGGKQFGHRQGCREFGELRRLEAHRAEFQP